MKEEGLCLGTSSGINIAGAMRLARELGPGSNIVTVLCDLGTRYKGKMFNLPYLEEKGLPQPKWIASGASMLVRKAVEETTIPEEEAARQQAENAQKV